MRSSVRSVAGCPSSGSYWRKVSPTSAVPQTASSRRPSIAGGVEVRRARNDAVPARVLQDDGCRRQRKDDGVHRSPVGAPGCYGKQGAPCPGISWRPQYRASRPPAAPAAASTTTRLMPLSFSTSARFPSAERAYRKGHVKRRLADHGNNHGFFGHP